MSRGVAYRRLVAGDRCASTREQIVSRQLLEYAKACHLGRVRGQELLDDAVPGAEGERGRDAHDGNIEEREDEGEHRHDVDREPRYAPRPRDDDDAQESHDEEPDPPPDEVHEPSEGRVLAAELVAGAVDAGEGGGREGAPER